MLKKMIEAALLQLGVSKETAASMVASIPDALEAPKDITADAVSKAALVKLSETLGSNDAFKTAVGDIRKGATGKLMDILAKKIRKAVPDITDEEVDGLPEENTYDELVTLALSKVKTAKATTEGDEVKRLNGELKETKAALKKATDVDIPEARKAGELERELVRIEGDVVESMIKGGELLVKPQFSRDMVMKQLAAEYTLQRVDGKVKLMKKKDDGSFAPAYDKEHNELTLDGETKRIGEAIGLYVMNNGGAGGKGGGSKKDEGTKDTNEGTRDGRKVITLRGEARAKQHAKDMDKARADGGSGNE